MTNHFSTPQIKSRQDKGNEKKSNWQKQQAVKEIVGYILQNGGRATGINKTKKSSIKIRNYADIMGDFAGHPFELLVGTRRLTPSQINYKEAVQNAGIAYRAVNDLNGFTKWFDKHLKSVKP